VKALDFAGKLTAENTIGRIHSNFEDNSAPWTGPDVSKPTLMNAFATPTRALMCGTVTVIDTKNQAEEENIHTRLPLATKQVIPNLT
jgi:hypothetical protein